MNEALENMNFSQRLRFFRKEDGSTQQEIANILGIDRSTYAYYELGKTEPSIKKLCKLAELFEISLDTLIGFKLPEKKDGE